MIQNVNKPALQTENASHVGSSTAKNSSRVDGHTSSTDSDVENTSVLAKIKQFNTSFALPPLQAVSPPRPDMHRARQTGIDWDCFKKIIKSNIGLRSSRVGYKIASTEGFDGDYVVLTSTLYERIGAVLNEKKPGLGNRTRDIQLVVFEEEKANAGAARASISGGQWINADDKKKLTEDISRDIFNFLKSRIPIVNFSSTISREDISKITEALQNEFHFYVIHDPDAPYRKPSDKEVYFNIGKRGSGEIDPSRICAHFDLTGPVFKARCFHLLMPLVGSQQQEHHLILLRDFVSGILFKKMLEAVNKFP